MAVMKDLNQMRRELDLEMRPTSRPLVNARDEPGQCDLCAGKMVVQKSRGIRTVKTIEHGIFDVRETVHVCKDKCRLPSGKLLTRGSSDLAEMTMPRSGTGYDVMVFVGRQRFQAHKQREEIREAIGRRFGLSYSAGKVSEMAHEFLDYLQRLHDSRMEDIAATLAADGGWPLHIDATGEDGRGTLLVAVAGWRKWTVGAWNIPTEREDRVYPLLEALIEKLGPPCAVMRDLGRAVSSAAESLVEAFELNIPILACHQHFLSDVGKGILDEHHNGLRKLFRHFGIRKKLRSLARDLGRTIGPDIHQARADMVQWLQSDPSDYFLPSGRYGLAIVRSMTQWTLDFHADGRGYGFPYDRPYLDLYERCRLTLRAAAACSRSTPNDPRVRRTLDRLYRTLAPVLDEHEFVDLARKLQGRVKLFEELRTALRLNPNPNSSNPAKSVHSSDPTSSELNDIQEAVEDLTASLQDRRPSRGPAADTREAIDLILDHLDRHGSYLWGHIVCVPTEDGEAFRIVDRTNNILENLFRLIKHLERRRSGRKNLAHDFELLPPAIALVPNLDCPDYVSIVCGSLDNLPHAFADLDTHERRKALFHAPTLEDLLSDPPQIATASLPPEDRKIIRNESMKRRIHKAANSRAPRPSHLLV